MDGTVGGSVVVVLVVVVVVVVLVVVLVVGVASVVVVASVDVDVLPAVEPLQPTSTNPTIEIKILVPHIRCCAVIPLPFVLCG